jgi:hypothetical protein
MVTSGSAKTAAQFQGGPIALSGYGSAGGVPGGPNFTLQSWVSSYEFGRGNVGATPAFRDNFLRSLVLSAGSRHL